MFKRVDTIHCFAITAGTTNLYLERQGILKAALHRVPLSLSRLTYGWLKQWGAAVKLVKHLDLRGFYISPAGSRWRADGTQHLFQILVPLKGGCVDLAGFEGFQQRLKGATDLPQELKGAVREMTTINLYSSGSTIARPVPITLPDCAGLLPPLSHLLPCCWTPVTQAALGRSGGWSCVAGNRAQRQDVVNIEVKYIAAVYDVWRPWTAFCLWDNIIWWRTIWRLRRWR